MSNRARRAATNKHVASSASSSAETNWSSSIAAAELYGKKFGDLARLAKRFDAPGASSRDVGISRALAVFAITAARCTTFVEVCLMGARVLGELGCQGFGSRLRAEAARHEVLI